MEKKTKKKPFAEYEHLIKEMPEKPTRNDYKQLGAIIVIDKYMRFKERVKRRFKKT